jgi:4-amino-4-deoxy-L-arabinose transferase-like glycosyltransferase
MFTRIRRYLILVAVILLAAITRFYHLKTQSIWFDEGWSAYAAVQPTLWDAVLADLTNPPLYYVLLNISTRFLGDTEFALRWFSLAWGLLTIPLAYQLARRLFDARAGVYAAVLVAGSPLLWWASQEARMYTLLAVLVLIAALAWHEVLQRHTRAAWVTLLFSEVLLLYAHNTGPVIALWLNAATLVAWIARRSLRRPSMPRWIGGQIIVGLLWMPWFVTQFVDLQEANSAVTSTIQLNLPLLSRVWQAFWAGVWGMVDQESSIVAFSGFAFLLWLVLIPWRKPNARWLIVHALLLMGGVLLGLIVLGNELHGRYLVIVAPLVLIPLGAGIARLPYFALRALVAAIFVVALGVSMLLAQDPQYQHDDARGMVRYYAENLTSNDSVLAWSYADRYELAYYWDRLGVQAQRITLPEGGDLDAVLPLLPESGDVALNVWFTQRADYRGMMPCLLGNGTINEPEAYTVYAMRNLLYHSPMLNLPDLQPFEGSVFDSGQPIASLNRIGGFSQSTADRALCLPVEITLTQDIDVDLKAAIIVRNRFGWEIARADAPFATANQRTTRQLQPGERAMAYPLLRLPVGTPIGDYDVRLRIYDEVNAPSGFDLTSPESPIASKDLQLGVWSLQQGAQWLKVNRESHLSIRQEIPAGQAMNLIGFIGGTRIPPTVYNGEIIPLTLLWRGDAALPYLLLTDTNDRWEVEIPALEQPNDDLTLDWRTVQVPLDAVPGTAELRLLDGTVIANYQVDALSFLAEEPVYDTAVNIEIPNVGTLIGYSFEVADHTQPFPVTLVWRVGEIAPQSAYTVFVQLLDAQGQLIAQSDSVPSQGTRPTNGWRPGEYIIDAHTLTFNDRAEVGTARLIVGLYDTLTGVRVPITPGQDYMVLSEAVEVK